jgi:hypothetical protein
MDFLKRWEWSLGFPEVSHENKERKDDEQNGF